MAQTNFVQIAMKKVKEKAYKLAYKAAGEACTQWLYWFHIQFNKPKHGKKYYYRGRTIIASLPDKKEYPAEKTGQFLDTLEIRPARYNPSAGFISIYLTVPVDYAKFLNATRKLFKESKDDFFVKYFQYKLDQTRK